MVPESRSLFKVAQIKRLLAVTFAASAVWLIFAGNLTLPETVVALVAGIATALGGIALRKRTGHRHTGLRLWMRHLPGIAVNSIADCWTVTLALFRQLTGRGGNSSFRRIKFRAVSDSPEDTGRRILATIGTTLQPNSYVAGFDREKGEVLIHELVPGRGDPVTGNGEGGN
jgi:hypothetical protein